jgi:hypothetical protein
LNDERNTCNKSRASFWLTACVVNYQTCTAEKRVGAAQGKVHTKRFCLQTVGGVINALVGLKHEGHKLLASPQVHWLDDGWGWELQFLV